MLRIPCPICGTRDEVEYNYGGDAGVRRPGIAETSLEAWIDFLFKRENIRGAHREYWHHVNGCRQWLVVQRDTRTHAIASVKLAREDRRDSVNDGGGPR
jgi:sarcosine oxidase subunit delta